MVKDNPIKQKNKFERVYYINGNVSWLMYYIIFSNMLNMKHITRSSPLIANIHSNIYFINIVLQ